MSDEGENPENSLKTNTKGTPARGRATAVAVQNDLSNRQELPKITAVGHGAVAEKILQIAFEQGIKVRQDADLAEILAAVELDTEIPPEAITAVAEILIRVYQANGKLEALQKTDKDG